MNNLRIGHGFEKAKPLYLGGVHIPFERGMRAHSDGDVVLHALCDALLGAAALGDIGQHFPDTDIRFAGIDSRELLKQVRQLISEHAYTVNNVDITVIAQVPKLAPHILAMRECIAADLALDVKVVNVKATTTEELGYIGREEGIAVHAVVLLMS